MNGITPKQRQCLTYIEGFIAEHGYSPSYAEIMASLGYRSKSAVHALVHKLSDRGKISIMPGRSRSVELRNQH